MTARAEAEDFAADVVARFRRGELVGEQAAAAQEFIKNTSAIFHEHDRAVREGAREQKRADLAKEADRLRAEAQRAAAAEAELRDAMNRC